MVVNVEIHQLLGLKCLNQNGTPCYQVGRVGCEVGSTSVGVIGDRQVPKKAEQKIGCASGG